MAHGYGEVAGEGAAPLCRGGRPRRRRGAGLARRGNSRHRNRGSPRSEYRCARRAQHSFSHCFSDEARHFSGGTDAANQPIGAIGVVDENVPTVMPDTSLETIMSMFATSPVAIVIERDDDPSEHDHRRVTGILTKIDLLSYLATQTDKR